METDQFEIILERRLQLMRSVLGNKAREYAQAGDRLHNFHAASNMLDNTPEQALLGMLAKHLVSVIDLVKKGEPVPEAIADEKIGDSINYLVLLEALMHETRIKRERSQLESAPVYSPVTPPKIPVHFGVDDTEGF